MSTTKLFSTPVSMKGTPEQLEYLAGELEKLGYNRTCWYDLEEFTCICTGVNGTQAYSFINLDISSAGDYNRHFIPGYNPQLFLAIAAACCNDTWQGGEWAIQITTNKWYTIDPYAGMLLEDLKHVYRRPTLAEFIEHFQPKDMQTEPKERKIIGYPAPFDLWGGVVEKGRLFIKDAEPNTYCWYGWKMPAEIVETWTPEYEPEVTFMYQNAYAEWGCERPPSLYKSIETAIMMVQKEKQPICVHKLTYTGDEITDVDIAHKYVTEKQ